MATAKLTSASQVRIPNSKSRGSGLESRPRYEVEWDEQHAGQSDRIPSTARQQRPNY